MTNKHLLNQITPKDIDQLDQYKLVQLLDHLLKADVFKHNLLVTDHYVPTVKITTPDEGEDGRIIFNGETTSRLPKNRCYFQSKASKLSAQDCVNEVLDKNGELKLKVKEVIENNGCYVIFMSYDVGAKTNIEDREKAIFEKVKEKGLTVKSDQVHVSYPPAEL
jgi:hypothetical protein